MADGAWWACSEAAAAARERADACHDRLERLTTAGSSTPVSAARDVDRARADLDRALQRAELAAQRLEAVRQRAAEHRRVSRLVAGASLPPPALARPEQLRAWMGELGLAVEQLWPTYMAMGGSAEAIELDAYLHGALQLSTFERMVADQAVWELRHAG